LASFRELEAFAQMGTELDAATQARLDRGYRMVELLKQPQYRPMHVVDQILSIFAGTQGYLDDVPVDRVQQWETDFLNYIHTQKKDVWQLLDARKNEAKTLKSEDDETTKAVRAAISDFKRGYGKQPVSAA
jgi:F-type H+-transporting ATPase subunit alpha